MNARVAVVVRTKDRPLLLRRALRSILAQSHEDYVVVVVNDGGDESDFASVLDEFGPLLGERLHPVRHARSLGRWPSATAGVDAVDSEFIVIHDDDDTWGPDFLATTVAHLDAHAESAGVSVRTTIIWESIEGDRITELGRDVFHPSMTDLLLADHLYKNRFVPISFLYRRSLYRELGGFNEELQVVGDWEFHIRALTAARIDFLPDEGLAFWHQRPGTEGAAGNSVIDLDHLHDRYDRLVRDERLVAYVREYGSGLPLYLTHLLHEQRRLAVDETRAAMRDELHAQLGPLRDQIDRLQAIADDGFIPILRRKYWALRRRLSGTRTPDPQN